MIADDLTVVVLTRDEGHRLAAALEVVPRGARIFVLDAQSADDTVDVARDHGAEVEVRAWNGFVDARRYALNRVATGWTMMLDADERLEPALATALETKSGEGVAGYRVRRTTRLCGRRVRACGWDDERILRIVRTARARIVTHRGPADVHEQLDVDGTIGSLPGAIVHDSYPTVASYREKFNRYTAIEAASLEPSLLALAGAALLVPLRFAWGIARYGGWRDGWRGWFVAWNSARYAFVARRKAMRRAP